VIVHENSALRAMEGARIILDDGVRLARGVTIVAAVSVILGKRVSTSDGVAVVDCWDHDVADGTPRDRIPPPPPAAVVIGDGAYLAAGAVVLAGVTVGARAFIGEGAVVATDVPANSVAYGNPARVVRTYDPSSARWQAC
jgi:acetyltransferase-like isoleucine patch superfamily enzyme